MTCPHCDVRLLVSERQGVEIDYCPQCRGVWLDRGELDKIVDRSHAEMVRSTDGARSGRTDSRSGDDGRDGHRDEPEGRDQAPPPRDKERRSFLEDIFDF